MANIVQLMECFRCYSESKKKGRRKSNTVDYISKQEKKKRKKYYFRDFYEKVKTHPINPYSKSQVSPKIRYMKS